jgi:hypothetical protein
MAANVVNLVEEARLAAAVPATPMFTVGGRKYTLDRALAKLREMKQGSKLEWWEWLEVTTSADGTEPKLRCTHCSKLMTASNPSQTAAKHMSARACSGLRRRAAATAAAAAAAAAGSSSTGASGSGAAAAAAAAGKRKRDSSIMVASAGQQQSFERCLARFFYKNAIPLQLTEDPDLKQAVAHVGLLPPSRRDLSNRLLDDEYNKVQAANNARLQAQPLVQLTSDGWRRKCAVRGVPLINVLALLPAGGSIFIKVVAAPGVVKDKHWVKARHEEWASLITGGRLERLVGMVMDNTKTNM